MSRLIDADEFERQLNELLLPKLIERYGEDEALRGLHFSFNDCIDNLRNQKTIEARAKGEWIKKKSMIYCSSCYNGFEAIFISDYNFCPNCGADMRGDSDGHK